MQDEEDRKSRWESIRQRGGGGVGGEGARLPRFVTFLACFCLVFLWLTSVTSFDTRYGDAATSVRDPGQGEREARWPEDTELDEALSSAKLRKAMKKTAQSQRCGELLGFVEVYMELKTNSRDAEDRLILSERLFSSYLRVGCSKGECVGRTMLEKLTHVWPEINLSHAVRVPLEALGAKLQRELLEDCTHAEFEAAFQEVRNMIATAVWPAYKQQRDAPKKGLLGGIFRKN